MEALIKTLSDDISGHHSSRLAPDHYGTILIAKAILVLALIIGRKRNS